MLKIHSMVDLNCATTSRPSKHSAKFLFGWLGICFLSFPKGWDRVSDRRIVLFAAVMLILWLQTLAGYQQSG